MPALLPQGPPLCPADPCCPLRLLPHKPRAAHYYQLAARTTLSRDLAAWASYVLGVIRSTNSDHAAALEAAQAGLEARPRSPELLRAVAHALAWRSGHEAAVEMGTRARAEGCLAGACSLPAQAAFLWIDAWFEGACDIVSFALHRLGRPEEAAAADADCVAAKALREREGDARSPLVTGLQAVALAQAPEDLRVRPGRGTAGGRLGCSRKRCPCAWPRRRPAPTGRRRRRRWVSGARRRCAAPTCRR